MLQKLLKLRTELLAARRKVLESAEKEDRDLNETETAEFDRHTAELKKLDIRIERARAQEEAEAVPARPVVSVEQPTTGPVSAPDAVLVGGSTASGEPAFFKRTKPLKAFKSDREAFWAGQWLMATLGRSERARQRVLRAGVLPAESLQLHADGGVFAVLGTGSNTGGGYLVPEEFTSAIIDLREQYGVFRRNARIEPMARDTKNVPRRTSGVTAYFVAENTEITASDASWDNVQLVAKKVAALVKMSTELSEDAAVDLAEIVFDEIAYAFALKEDQCGFVGDGTSTYGGILGVVTKIDDGTHTAGIKTAATGNTGFETLDLEDFHGVTAKLPEYARVNAKWYISSAGFSAAMERLAYAGGGNTYQQLADGRMQRMFLGYPVEISQVLNSTLGADTNKIKLLFGDLRRAAMLGDRREFTLQMSEHRWIELGQVGIVGTERIDINVHSLGDTSNAGPIVALKTPGA